MIAFVVMVAYRFEVMPTEVERLAILAVALGVGVVIAIDLAGDAATGSFRSSLENLIGKTDLQIVANGSVDERWMAKLAALPVNARFAPVIETQGILEHVGTVTVYGVDFVAQARGERAGKAIPTDLESAVIISSGLAKRAGLKEGGQITFTLQDAFIHNYGSHDDLLSAHGLDLSLMSRRVGLA
jgi:ABC-type lipoprotein release transport system permease subunit